jgi:hypothetical protein
MPRRAAALAALVAGVWLLTNPGWALLALAGMLLIGVPTGTDETVAAAAGRVRAAVTGVASTAKGAPRRSVAVSAMSLGVLAVPAGLLLAAGAGIALATLGGLLLGVSLLTGWGA